MQKRFFLSFLFFPFSSFLFFFWTSLECRSRRLLVRCSLPGLHRRDCVPVVSVHLSRGCHTLCHVSLSNSRSWLIVYFTDKCLLSSSLSVCLSVSNSFSQPVCLSVWLWSRLTFYFVWSLDAHITCVCLLVKCNFDSTFLPTECLCYALSIVLVLSCLSVSVRLSAALLTVCPFSLAFSYPSVSVLSSPQSINQPALSITPAHSQHPSIYLPIYFPYSFLSVHLSVSSPSLNNQSTRLVY